MNIPKTVEKLAGLKKRFNEHYEIISERYPELSARLRELDKVVTGFEDIIDDLIENAQANDLSKRETTRQAGQLIQKVIIELELKTFESL